MSDNPKSIIDIDIDIVDTSDDIEDVSFDFPDLEGKSLLDNPFDDIIPHQLKSHVPEKNAAIAAPQVKDLHRLKNCPRCTKPLLPAISIDDSQSPSFLECPECGTLINKFKPTKYQAEYLRRPEIYKLTAGGFGTGKSRVNIEYVIKHLFLIPNARVCVAARSYPALDATFIKEFYGMFPKRLLRHKNEQKHELSFTNGAELLFRSFDDPTKLKSMNLTLVIMVEASDCPMSGFDMMQTRLRNTAAMIPYYDADGNPIEYYDTKTKEYKIKYRVDARYMGLETNPDSGWVKGFLLEAAVVQFYGGAYDEGYRFKKERDPDKYVQVVDTQANPYLPDNYEEQQTKGKSKAYVQQFFRGSFNFSSNLVIPNFGTCVVPPHPLPPEFDDYGRRALFYCVGVDYGISDHTHIIFSAFSTITKKLYVYAELRMNNSDVKTISKAYRKEYRSNGTKSEGLLMRPRFDGRSYNKRESDLYTIGGAFEAQGLYFEPSFASIEARVIKMNALFNHDQIEVFSTCEFLIEEGLNWKFKLDKQGKSTGKPEDKKDHGIQGLAFIVVELPHNLKELSIKAYLPTGTEIKHDTQLIKKSKNKEVVFNPLMEEKNGNSNTSFNSNPIVPGGTHVNRSFGIHDDIYEEDDNYHDNEFNRPLSAYVPGRR